LQERKREYALAIETLKQILILTPQNRWANERLQRFQTFQKIRGEKNLIGDAARNSAPTGQLDIRASEIPWQMLAKYPKGWKEITVRDTAKIVVLPDAKKPEEKTIVRVYDIRDMVKSVPMFEAPGLTRDGNGFRQRQKVFDEVRSSIKGSVDPGSWKGAGGKSGTISEIGGQLVITQTEENHRKTLTLIKEIQKTKDLQAAVVRRKQSKDSELNSIKRRAGLDAYELARKLRFNRGQKTQIASLNLNVDAATAGSLGVKFHKGNNGVSYTTIDEAQFRTLMEIDVAARAGVQGAQVGANEIRQDTIIGTDALLANDMSTNVTYSYDKGNTLDVNDNPITVPHEKYVLIDNGGYLTAIRAGEMQHWSQASKRIEFVKAPQTIEIPRVGELVKLEKTLVKPSDEMVVRFDYQWKGR